MGKWKIVEADTATSAETYREVDTFDVAFRAVLDKLNTPDDHLVRVEGPAGEKFGRWWFQRRRDLDKPRLEAANKSGDAVVDRIALEQHLALAEKHVAEGAEHVRKQREIVAHLEEIGANVASARQLLVTFERQEAARITDRDRLIGELAELSDAPQS